MKRRIRRALKRAGLYNAFHITLIAVLLTGFCVILFNVKEPEQQEKEPEEIQAEVMQNPETMTQTAENIEDKYKVFDTMSEDWGSDDLEGFVFYDLPEQYADKGYFPEKMQIYTRCLCKQYDVPYALALMISLQLDGNMKTSKKYNETIKEQQEEIDSLKKEIEMLQQEHEDTIAEIEQDAAVYVEENKKIANMTQTEDTIRLQTERDTYKTMYEQLLNRLVNGGAA